MNTQSITYDRREDGNFFQTLIDWSENKRKRRKEDSF